MLNKRKAEGLVERFPNGASVKVDCGPEKRVRLAVIDDILENADGSFCYHVEFKDDKTKGYADPSCVAKDTGRNELPSLLAETLEPAVRVGEGMQNRDHRLFPGCALMAGKSVFLIDRVDLSASNPTMWMSVTDGPLKGKSITILKTGATVGRLPENTICVADDFELSRNHAGIVYDRKQQQFYVYDMGSTNGTFIKSFQGPASSPPFSSKPATAPSLLFGVQGSASDSSFDSTPAFGSSFGAPAPSPLFGARDKLLSLKRPCARNTINTTGDPIHIDSEARDKLLSLKRHCARKTNNMTGDPIHIDSEGIDPSGHTLFKNPSSPSKLSHFLDLGKQAVHQTKNLFFRNKAQKQGKLLRSYAFLGKLEKLEWGLQQGAIINEVGSLEDYDALEEEERDDTDDIAPYLDFYDRRIDYDYRYDYYRGTALHYACYAQRKAVVEFLLGANADPLVQDSEKKTAFQIAQERGNVDILDAMKKSLEGSPEFPMYVCKRADLEELEELQKHEVVVGHPQLVMVLPANTEPCLTLFVSHRWISNAHPDQDSQFRSANNKKLLALKAFLKSPELREVQYIWIDFQSIPQDDLTTQQLAINSLPFYVRQCGHFVSLFGTEHKRSLIDEYLMRGWCLLEVFSSFSRRDTQLWRYNIDRHEAQPLMQSSLALFISNPLVGHFTGNRTSEQQRIAPMLIRLCGLVVLEQEEDTHIKERAAQISNFIHKNDLLNSSPGYCLLS